MKRPIYCVVDDKNTTSPSHSGLFLSSLAINTWLVLIENMLPSGNKNVHTAEIGYKYNSENVKLMKVNDIKLLDVIKDVQEAVDVENFAHQIDRAHDVLENDVGVAADDGLNWFFDIHNNETDAEGTAALALL